MSETRAKSNLKVQKRITKDLTKAGLKRIKFNQNSLDDIKSALTKKDIKNLIKKGAIKILQKQNISHSRIRKNLIQKRKGRKKGIGSRKGKHSARLNPKREWINKIRAQRIIIKKLKDKNLITSKSYRELYSKSKGGFFRSKRHVLIYLKEHNLIKKNEK